MTRAEVLASAILADRYAAAAAAAAREATRAANLAMRPGRVRNEAAQFTARAAAALDGAGYERTLRAPDGYGQLAGIASTAKYAAAAANAARYAARAASEAGAGRAARRAERAAMVADGWAKMALHRAETSHYAPYTAHMTARYACAAAVAARNAAHRTGPLGPCTTSAIGLAIALLPAASRDRYAEEWKSELWHVPARRRARFAAGVLAAAVRLAVLLRLPGRGSGS